MIKTHFWSTLSDDEVKPIVTFWTKPKSYSFKQSENKFIEIFWVVYSQEKWDLFNKTDELLW